MKSLSIHLTTMRNWIFAIVLLSVAACDKNDNDSPADELNTADQPTDVIVAPNILVRVSDLPAPDPTTSAVNWPQVLMEQPAGARFQVPQGFAINLFAKVPNARLLAVAPNGDLFVAQSGMNQISVLRDTNNDGAVDETFVWDVGGMLFVPYGMAFKDNFFYVTSTNAILRYPYTSGQTKASGAPTVVAPLLGGGQHAARALVIGDGNQARRRALPGLTKDVSVRGIDGGEMPHVPTKRSRPRPTARW